MGTLITSIETAPRRVLLVEDDEDLRDSVAAVLQDSGYEVESTRNGHEALGRLRDAPADLVILDLQMPVMDGWQFRAAQRADRAIADIPVIVITADGDPKAQAIHADALVRKPFDPAALLRHVEETFIARDRRRTAERREESDRLALLGAIAAGVGHEINNPLSTALGTLEMLEERLPDVLQETQALRARLEHSGAEASVGRIEQALLALQSMAADGRSGAARAGLMVKNLQSLSRGATDERAAVDLHRVIEFSMVMAWSQIRYRARLIRSFGAIPPVWGNEGRLNQVFLNLLVNAAQSMQPARAGENEIEVTTRAEDASVVVEVRDNGPGMSPALQARIFEPFFTTKEKGEGTGLGLSICRDVVTAHGGTLDVLSTLGRGTTLRVRLPAHTRATDTAAPPQVETGRRSAGEAADATGPDARRPIVWVLDDEALVARTVQRILERACHVLVARDAAEVLAWLEAGRRYDAFVCDLMMPEMSGMELWSRVNERWPTLAEHMVFASGGTFTREATEFTEQPGRLFVQKPFEIVALRALIERVTRQ